MTLKSLNERDTQIRESFRHAWRVRKIGWRSLEKYESWITEFIEGILQYPELPDSRFPRRQFIMRLDNYKDFILEKILMDFPEVSKYVYRTRRHVSAWLKDPSTRSDIQISWVQWVVIEPPASSVPRDQERLLQVIFRQG